MLEAGRGLWKVMEEQKYVWGIMLEAGRRRRRRKRHCVIIRSVE
jgi:hypothetical protein